MEEIILAKAKSKIKNFHNQDNHCEIPVHVKMIEEANPITHILRFTKNGDGEWKYENKRVINESDLEPIALDLISEDDSLKNKIHVKLSKVITIYGEYEILLKRATNSNKWLLDQFKNKNTPEIHE